MDIQILKSRVDTKSRKLKATWTIESNELWASNNLTTIDLGDIGYPHGVNSIDVTFVRREEINQWVRNTFNENDYLFAGQQKEFIWFRKEKHRTLLLMKWS